MAKIERGTRPLRVAEAAAIATIFPVPPLAIFLGPPPEGMPLSLNELHKIIAAAENVLNEMKDDMTRSAARYVKQEAQVLALAQMLNQVALEAEIDDRGGRDAPET